MVHGGSTLSGKEDSYAVGEVVGKSGARRSILADIQKVGNCVQVDVGNCVQVEVGKKDSVDVGSDLPEYLKHKMPKEWPEVVENAPF